MSHVLNLVILTGSKYQFSVLIVITHISGTINNLTIKRI